MGVLIAATSLLSSNDIPRLLVTFLFAVGALLAVLSILANESQRSYYRAARELKGTIEDRLDLKELALATTPGMGSRINRLGRVGTFLKIMLVAIAAVDLVGAGIGLEQTLSEESAPHLTQVLVRADSAAAYSALVIASGVTPLVTKRIEPGENLAPIALEPGSYQALLLGDRVCRRPLEVRSGAVQLARIAC